MGDTAHLLEGKGRGVTGPTANTHRSLPTPKRRAVPTALVTPHRASEILYWKIIAVYYIEDLTRVNSENRAHSDWSRPLGWGPTPTPWTNLATSAPPWIPGPLA